MKKLEFLVEKDDKLCNQPGRTHFVSFHLNKQTQTLMGVWAHGKVN